MKKMRDIVLFGILMILIAGCGSGGSGSSGMADTESVSASISASGGSVTTPSGNAGVDVPAGALSSDQSITVSPNSKVTPPGNIAGAYDYGPDGQTFSSPVTVSIKYDPDLMPAGMSSSDLRLAWLAGNGIWEIISGSTVDETNNLVSGQTSHFSTYTVVVHERKPFGEQTGTFNSVIAYSNGTTGYTSNEYNTYDGYNTGMKWLCDEYVNRYYKQVYEKEIRIEGRKASDYYQNAAARGLTAYPNDGTEQPQVGDILVSEYGDYGHVAIVREVQNNKIFVIQQNWSDNGADDRYPITRSSNHVYPFDGKKGNYAVKGWLRCNHNTAYTISGQVTYLSVGLSGVTVTLTGTTSATVTTDAQGHYSFSNAQNGNYTITASKTGYSFNPASIHATVNNDDLTDQDFTASANTYTISGKVSGNIISGVTITLTGTGSSTTTTDGSGNYTFTGAANGNYTVTPSLAGYTFSPVSTAVTVNGEDKAGINFTSTLYVEPTYTVSGKISGDSMGGVIVTLTGNTTSSTTTDGSGNYTFSGVTAGCYALTPTLTGYTFSPVSRRVVVSGNVTGQNFTAKANTYTISGSVSGDIVSGVTITLTGTGSVTATTDSDGNYSFTGAKNGAYTITVSKTGYTFSPASINAKVNSADLNVQTFTATENTYTISGTVTGDVISGVTITLTGTGTVSTTTDSSGNYIFTGAKNGSYTITASKTGYTFSPTSINATVSFADLTGQNFTATENTYTISGTVSGDVASGVTITLTGSGSTTTTTDGSGNYSFTGAKNGSYTIAASKTGYTFSPTSISATVNYANLTGQNFTATILSLAKAITTYSLNGVAGTINETAKTITVSLPRVTDVTTLVATFTTTGKTVHIGTTQQTSGTSANDFTSPVTYTVTAEDSSKVDYIVNVALVPWTKQLGTASDDAGTGVAIDNSGNIYVCGYTGGSLDGNTHAGGYDTLLVKYDAAGTKQWTRQLGTVNEDVSAGIAIDNINGYIYVTGYTVGSFDGNSIAGGRDIFLVKYDTAGTKQWSRQLGSASIDEAYGVAVDQSGNIYITGSTKGSMDGSWTPETIDMFLVKYNAAGTKQWTRQLGTNASVGMGVAVDSSGNVYVTGYTYDDVDGNINAGNNDIFLVKYNAAGTKQWTRELGTSSGDSGLKVAVDISGNIYVTGTTLGSLDGNTNAGVVDANSDIILVKYSAAGTKQWTRQLGTPQTDFSKGIAVDTSGYIYLTGYTYGSLDGNTSVGSGDICLVKYDSAGTKQSTRLLGTTSRDYGLGIAMDNTSGYVYVTGMTEDDLDGNTSAGSLDMFLAKYGTNGVIQ